MERHRSSCRANHAACENDREARQTGRCIEHELHDVVRERRELRDAIAATDDDDCRRILPSPGAGVRSPASCKHRGDAASPRDLCRACVRFARCPHPRAPRLSRAHASRFAPFAIADAIAVGVAKSLRGVRGSRTAERGCEPPSVLSTNARAARIPENDEEIVACQATLHHNASG